MVPPSPFRLEVPQAALDDLRERLSRTRFPDEAPGKPWTTGTSLSYLKDLLSCWKDRFDWRAQEARLNGFRQFTIPLRGIELHFIHEPSSAPGAIPLLLLHGWPGSIVEFLGLIPKLTARFSIVAPSLPGFTLSFGPGQPRLGVEEMAELFVELMHGLGYERFGVQGGDWGAFIASRLGCLHADKVLGIHLNYLPLRRDAKPTTPEEERYAADVDYWVKEESGYSAIQGTRPQTLAYGLTDSPAGLAAWIAEKFHRWTDCGGVIENAVRRDDLLANISLYWFTGAIGSSFWPYYARTHGGWPIPRGRTIDVPTGYVEFPREILRPPRSLAAKTYTNLRRWMVAGKGGHFAALEQPDVLAREIREFYDHDAWERC